MTQEDLNKKNQSAIALKKARGSLQSIINILESSETGCKNVIQQMDAVTGLIKSAREKIIIQRLDTCLREFEGDEKRIDELKDLYKMNRKN